MLDNVFGFARYARGLRRFLSTTLTAPDAARVISRNLETREARFLALLDNAVFGAHPSPYRRLFAIAGVERGDVAAMVRADGLEHALARLHDAGVWISLAEAKGKEPVRRGSQEFHIGRHGLNNPLAARDFVGTTGRTRSAGTTFWVDLRDVLDSSTYPTIARSAFGVEQADGVLWLPAPPGVAGMRRALWWSKAGMDVRRWFAQTVPTWRPSEAKHAAFVRWTIAASRRAGRPLPTPEPTAPRDAVRVARWLADAVAAGQPAALFGTPTSGLRVCTAAADAGLNIAGTLFSFGGEPYTDAKARAIHGAGCRAESSYYISEFGGPVAVGCPNATTVDEAHLVSDRIAVVEKERTLTGGAVVRPMYVTTISPLVPQVAINVETGDYAVHGRATCGCPFAEAGLERTIHSLRSYEKLTTEGMHFIGPELITLLEDHLPRRFGGGAIDYQLVEQEDTGGRSQLVLVVSPRVGPLDEKRVTDEVFAFLRSRGTAERMMADIWMTGDVLRVARREPEISRGGKVQSLHISDITKQGH